MLKTKKARHLILGMIIIALCLILASCSPSCKVRGCNNDPAQFMGVKSDYCLIHVGHELFP
jgi:hypothetical protein